ncbi:serine/arginine-rich splicing factor RSZ22A-like [Olea europaea var. sylvestris]|uniref:serine/arginine-rich splicing factor RSZ22A-like n=1 Tax=Olea europaea var. sylvestris TaxID=158386 RepID=UPI000C1CE8FD|nr:serine/arginine-rich splicing factor RSZ22A-like [Olea europaea var. sylvestris]
MSRVYVGNLDPRVTERELEDEFRTFGVIRSVWVARRPPGYAFIDFDDRRDAQDAIRELDGRIIEIYIVNIYLLWSSDHPILRPGIHLSGYEKIPFYLVGLFSWELMMST